MDRFESDSFKNIVDDFEGWYDIIITIYVTSNLVLISFILYTIVQYYLHYRIRKSVNKPKFVLGLVILAFLIAVNAFRHIMEVWYPYTLQYTLLDLILITACVILSMMGVQYFIELKDQYTPAEVDRLKKTRWDAAFTTQINIDSTISLHQDQNITSKVLCDEMAKDNNHFRLNEIRRRLKLFSELGEGDESEYIDLNQVLEESKKELSTEIERGALEILNENLPTIHCYPDQLKAVFKELIRNVLLHNKEENRKLIVFQEELLEDWMLIFEDNGEGMYPKYQKQFFNLFKLDENDRADLTQGFGLALCRKIMRNHHGHIWIESDYYSGVSMYLSIPKYLILNLKPEPDYVYP